MDLEHLIHMADQIARNLAAQGDAIADTAQHIRSYWEPRMIAALLSADRSLLDNQLQDVADLLEAGEGAITTKAIMCDN